MLPLFCLAAIILIWFFYQNWPDALLCWYRNCICKLRESGLFRNRIRIRISEPSHQHHVTFESRLNWVTRVNAHLNWGDIAEWVAGTKPTGTERQHENIELLLSKSIYTLFTFTVFLFWFSVLLVQFNIDYLHVAVEAARSWKMAQSLSSAGSLQLWETSQQQNMVWRNNLWTKSHDLQFD